MSPPTAHRVRAWQRLRAAQRGHARDGAAVSLRALMPGIAAGKLVPYSMGALVPRFRARCAADVLAWAATAHQLGHSGLIAGRSELSELVRAAPSTVQRALEELSAGGWLVLRPRTAAWRAQDGRWHHRERASALEPGPLLFAALRALRAARRPAPAPAAASAPPVPEPLLSPSDVAAALGAWRSRNARR